MTSPGIPRVLAPLMIAALQLTGPPGPAQVVLLGDKFVPVRARQGDVISFSLEARRSHFIAHVMRADGSRVENVFDREGTIFDFLRDGRVLQGQRASGGQFVVSIRRDGTDLRPLTDVNGNSWSAVSSPDGSRIAYISTQNGRQRLQVMNSDGSQSRNLSASSNVNESGMLSWSPDGQWIAFTSGSGDQREIAIIHPDGTGRRELTHSTVADFNPAFSPDGKRIAYTSNPTGGHAPFEGDNRIFLMNADGTDAHQVGDISPIHGGTSWSPSGDKLAINAMGRQPSSEFNIEIYEIGIDGRQLRQLTTEPPQPLLAALQTDGIAAAHRVFAEFQGRATAPSYSYAAMRRMATQSLANKDYAKAIAALTFNAEAFGAEDPDKWTDLGDAYKDAGDRENAVRAVRRALEANVAGADRDRAVKLLKELGGEPSV